MHACMYVCMYVSMYVHMQKQIHTYITKNPCAYIQTKTKKTNKPIHAHIKIQKQICICKPFYIHAQIFAYI